MQSGSQATATRLDLGDLLTVRRSGLFAAEWFLDHNSDIAKAGIDPSTHYCRYGWREGRFPNAYFDPAWYLRRNRDVRESGLEPLLHYIEHGEAEGRQPIAHFDPDWYRTEYDVPAGQLCLQHFLLNRLNGTVSPIPEFDAAHYRRQSPDVVIAGMDPFEHYLVSGASEGRSPSPGFDGAFYRQRYLQHRPDANPLLHYRMHRHDPGVVPVRPTGGDTDIPREVRRNTAPGPLFEPVEPLPPDAAARAMVLAFYLPQFHSIPENDAWWGDGFTEWTNVGRGLPRFAGHYQPRIPRDLGHYRLDNPEAYSAQVRMARGAGLHGFVFYFYWFNGRRLLNGPLDAMLADTGEGFPFCLMWANENWTRRWDGAEQEVLIGQDYREQDEPALVAEFARHFADPRYIRLQGRPVLMVYRASLIPNAAAAVARWREAFRALGEDPLFIMAQSFDCRDPRPFGMDAAVEFPPHKLTAGMPDMPDLHMLDHAATARVVSYDDVAARSDTEPTEYPLIRTALPGWDNDARRQGAGLVVHGSTPAKYGAWLDRLIDAAIQQPVAGTPIVCINAWNEWAEGAYLEPDVHFGGAYLNATARAIAGAAARPGRARVLLVGHDAFPAGAQMLLLSLGRHMREVMGVEVAFLLLGGGALADEYRAVAPTTVATAADLPHQVRVLRGQGFSAAVVNSAASATACIALSAAGIACTLLVHELPRLLQERNLSGPAGEAAKAARHVVFAAPVIRDRFQELTAMPADRAVLLPQGLYRPVAPATPAAQAAMRDSLGVPSGALLAIGVGYADLRKGFDLFLQVWRLAHAADAGIHAVWIGDIDPSVAAYLAPEMAAAAATGTFHHLPRQPDAADWFACADVHLLTSREDPFPSVVLEAMSAGIPTVAFEGAGGAPGLLHAHGAGAAVPLGDATAMLHQLRLLHARSTPEDRARLAGHTRQHFDFGAYAARVLRLALPEVPGISVVVPNYNYARYLPGRIASIMAQTCPVLEVIVLDDASTDSSAMAVQQAALAAGRRVRWLPNRENSGSVFRQWRRAAELAQGEWLWIAEADDMAEPGFLAALAKALQDVPDAVMAFTDSRAIDAAGTAMWPDHLAYYAKSGAPALARDAVLPAAEVLRTCLSQRNLILNASAVLWRRTALLDALLRCADDLDGYTMAGDWRLYAELLSGPGTVAYVAQPLNIHRRHAASVTHSLPAARHLAEVSRMQRHMRGLLGPDRALLAGQRRALRETRASLTAGPLRAAI